MYLATLARRVTENAGCLCCCAALQARPLTVEDDMQPVVGFFVQQGLSTQQIVQVRLKILTLCDRQCSWQASSSWCTPVSASRAS